MAEPSITAINVSELFPHLPRAPIVEAVIEFRVRAEHMDDHDDFCKTLRGMLPGYPKMNDMSQGNFSFAVSNPAHNRDSAGSLGSAEHLWIGQRVESADRLQVAMFTRDFFSFSRLKPYEDWTTFLDEALRLWRIHAKLTGATEIARLGVRFINRFDISMADLDPGDYFKGVPTVEGELPRSGFLYRDELVVPGHPYGAVLTRTIQPAGTSAGMASLLLDVDTFTLKSFPSDQPTIDQRIAHLHWLKNRIFFANVTEQALEMCR